MTPEAEALQLRARLRWLSDYINNHVLVSADPTGRIEDIETGSNLASLLGTRNWLTNQATLPSQTGSQPEPAAPGPSDISHTQAESGVLSISNIEVEVSGLDPRHPSAHHDGRRYTSSTTEPGIGGPSSCQVSFQSLAGTNLAENAFDVGHGRPADVSAQRFVDAYFRNVNRAYPFVNQDKILQGLDALGDFAQRLQDSQSTLLYLVMSIGCTALERAGQVPRDTAKLFKVAYADIMQECVCLESIESMQILMLLALYSLFDPAAPSTYSIVGIAARQAIASGLTRRPANEDAYTPAEVELRNRLYWSIFALDRLTAVAQGLPVALTDENADVPLPSLTVEEFASAERSMHAKKLQTSRHIIVLRQLESEIMSHVHFKKLADITELAPSNRRATLSNLRASIDDWYSQGCLMSPMETDYATVHSSFAWLSARYYYLLLLLYYPNGFNSSAAAVSRQQILQFTQRQVQFTSALFQQRQLPLNSNTLYRLMPVCMVLMHDFMATCICQSPVPFQAREDVAMLLSILEAFPAEWVLAHQTAQVMRQFSEAILGGKPIFSQVAAAPLPLGAAGSATTTIGGSKTAAEDSVGKESQQALIESCIAELTSVMHKMLGQSTCFQFVEYPADDRRTERPVTEAVMPPYQKQQPPLAIPMASQMPALDMNGIRGGISGVAPAMGYEWGTLDMDFL